MSFDGSACILPLPRAAIVVGWMTPSGRERTFFCWAELSPKREECCQEHFAGSIKFSASVQTALSLPEPGNYGSLGEAATETAAISGCSTVNAISIANVYTIRRQQ
jgi:hypothetical protein